ncbi:MAG: hypothetical protein C0402_05460 [Thermodesulfovibrio sp.]|nr:hypothetical protein [Thermodesulfovibrio sp.]
MKREKSLGLNVARLIGYCHDLATLAMSKAPNQPEPLTPGVELILQLSDFTKGWKLLTSLIADKGALCAELWTDAITNRRVVVVFRKSKKGFFPAFYMPVDSSENAAAVAEQAVCKTEECRRSKVQHAA